jgi:hypothetical protein
MEVTLNLNQSTRKLNILEEKVNEIIKTFEQKGRNNLNPNSNLLNQKSEDENKFKEVINSYKSSRRLYQTNSLDLDNLLNIDLSSKQELNKTENSEVKNLLEKARLYNYHMRHGDYKSSSPKYRKMQEYTANIYYNHIPSSDRSKKYEINERINYLKDAKKNSREKILETKNKNHEKVKQFGTKLKKPNNNLFSS